MCYSMPPCCVCLGKRIADLEGRISVLHQIKEEEQLLDSVVDLGPTTNATACRKLDSTVQCDPHPPARSPWPQLGAKDCSCYFHVKL